MSALDNSKQKLSQEELRGIIQEYAGNLKIDYDFVAEWPLLPYSPSESLVVRTEYDYITIVKIGSDNWYVTSDRHLFDPTICDSVECVDSAFEGEARIERIRYNENTIYESPSEMRNNAGDEDEEDDDNV